MRKPKGFKEDYLWINREFVKFHVRYMDEINSLLPPNAAQINRIKNYFYELNQMFLTLRDTKCYLESGQSLLAEFASNEGILPKVRALLPELRRIVDLIGFEKSMND